MNDAALAAKGGTADVERVIAAARDALTDEMVSRMTEAVSGGLTLLDQVHRSGVAGAIPALVQLVENGDLPVEWPGSYERRSRLVRGEAMSWHQARK